jgi:hypothetical protein
MRQRARLDGRKPRERSAGWLDSMPGRWESKDETTRVRVDAVHQGRGGPAKLIICVYGLRSRRGCCEVGRARVSQRLVSSLSLCCSFSFLSCEP